MPFPERGFRCRSTASSPPPSPGARFYVADGANNRRQTLDRDQNVVRIVEGAPWNFEGVRYLAQDEKGRIYLCGKYANRVLIVDKDWKILHTLTGERSPEGVDARGNCFWVSDSGGNRVVLYEWN